jgi:hypothetical protein
MNLNSINAIETHSQNARIPDFRDGKSKGSPQIKRAA